MGNICINFGFYTLFVFAPGARAAQTDRRTGLGENIH